MKIGNDEFFQNDLLHPDASKHIWVDQMCSPSNTDESCRAVKQRWLDQDRPSEGPGRFQRRQMKYYERLCRGENYQVSSTK